MNYFVTGSGSAIGSPSVTDPAVTTLLPDHSARLPLELVAPEGFVNEGIDAMTNFPLFGTFSGTGGGRVHWGIRGSGGAGPNRWEVDDFIGDDSNDTHHQIWMR